MKQSAKVVGQARLGGLQFVPALAACDGLQGGLAQGVLQSAAGFLLRLQLVAQGHQFIDFGDDAGLFLRGRQREGPRRKVIGGHALLACRSGHVLLAFNREER